MLGANGQSVNTLAGGGGNGVDQSAGRDGRAGFADAAGRLGARHDMHLDLGRLVVAHHRIIIEVMLHDPAVLDRDLSLKSRGQAVDGPAFHLCLYRVGIDDPTGVHCTPDLVNAHGAIRN